MELELEADIALFQLANYNFTRKDKITRPRIMHVKIQIGSFLLVSFLSGKRSYMSLDRLRGTNRLDRSKL